jgi:hypothetical protein
MKYDLEQKKTIKDQSIYEPPATRRQADIEVEKAERGLEQAQKSYSLQYRKELANLQDATSTYSQAQRKLEQMEDKIKQFNIFAPKKGMVIYTRSWNGRQQEGSTVDTWGDFTVAELPDLSKMISRTYVNEIDISKVKVGQQVRIGIDAFPDKKFTGKVTSVANVGEQLPNSNAKVFEVNILINEFDSIVRPSMTSKNTIVTATIDNVLFAPIETVVSTDSISYVFRKDGGRIVKQQVITGESNDNEFVLKAGVNENDELLLLPPGNADKLKLVKIPPEELKKHEMTPISKTNIKPGEKPKEIQNVAPPPIKYSNVPKKENTVTPFQKVTDAPKSNPKVNSTIKAADPKKDATGSNTINNSKIYNNNVVFRILIATCTKEVSTGSERFAGLPEIRMYRHQQLFEYTIGKESTSAALSGLLKEAKTKGFSDAYIVAFKGDEQITLAEAKKLISEKNK